MYRSALTLQPRSKQIERIDRTGAESSAESTNSGRGEITECDVVLITFLSARFALGDELFDIFECSEIDGAVGKHANKAHGKATIEGANTRGSPHLASSGEDQGVAVKATFDRLILNTTVSVSANGLTPEEDDAT